MERLVRVREIANKEKVMFKSDGSEHTRCSVVYEDPNGEFSCVIKQYGDDESLARRNIVPGNIGTLTFDLKVIEWGGKLYNDFAFRRFALLAAKKTVETTNEASPLRDIITGAGKDQYQTMQEQVAADIAEKIQGPAVTPPDVKPLPHTEQEVDLPF